MKTIGQLIGFIKAQFNNIRTGIFGTLLNEQEYNSHLDAVRVAAHAGASTSNGAHLCSSAANNPQKYAGGLASNKRLSDASQNRLQALAAHSQDYQHSSVSAIHHRKRLSDVSQQRLAAYVERTQPTNEE